MENNYKIKSELLSEDALLMSHIVGSDYELWLIDAMLHDVLSVDGEAGTVS